MNYYKEANWDLIPSYMHEGVKAYVMEGRPLGGFLHSVFSGASLSEVAARADAQNSQNLLGWAKFVYNEVPCECQGTPERVAAWQKLGGILGREARRA